MTSESFGDQLNRILYEAKVSLFEQGQLAQLTYGAFDIAARALQSSEQQEVTISFPLGYRPDKSTIEEPGLTRKRN